MNNYNKIASFYDALAKLVFGQAQIDAQKDQLAYLNPGDKILIVGGGTGWILDEIAKLFPQKTTVDFVEASAKMIAIAKKRRVSYGLVAFINIPIEEFRPNKKYDVVITSFFFDNFNQEHAKKNFSIIDNCLKKNGLWFFSDFYVRQINKTTWKSLMLKVMYLFFNLTANVEAKRLVSMQSVFKDNGFEAVTERWHYKRFIRAVVYKKQI